MAESNHGLLFKITNQNLSREAEDSNEMSVVIVDFQAEIRTDHPHSISQKRCCLWQLVRSNRIEFFGRDSTLVSGVILRPTVQFLLIICFLVTLREDSAFRIASRPQARRPRSRGSTPRWGKMFISSPKPPDLWRSPTNLLFSGHLWTSSRN